MQNGTTVRIDPLHQHLVFGPFPSTSSALHSVGPCVPLDRREVPSVIIDYEDDKENMPNESDYEDLPSMYKDEEDDVDDEDDDDDDDDDSIFTSERLQLRRKLRRFGNIEGLNVSAESSNLLSRNFLLCLFVVVFL